MSDVSVLGLFMLCGIAMVIGYAFAGRIYNYTLRLYMKWGWSELAERWSERKSWWLPTCKAVCLILAVISFAAALWVLLEL